MEVRKSTGFKSIQVWHIHDGIRPVLWFAFDPKERKMYIVDGTNDVEFTLLYHYRIRLYAITYKSTQDNAVIKTDVLFEEELKNYYPGHVCRELADSLNERIEFEVRDPDNKRIDWGNYIPEHLFSTLT